MEAERQVQEKRAYLTMRYNTLKGELGNLDNDLKELETRSYEMDTDDVPVANVYQDKKNDINKRIKDTDADLLSTLCLMQNSNESCPVSWQNATIRRSLLRAFRTKERNSSKRQRNTSKIFIRLKKKRKVTSTNCIFADDLSLMHISPLQYIIFKMAIP